MLAPAAVRAAAPGFPEPRAHGPKDKFNCGRNWWEAVTAFLGGSWPEEKKEWCCKHRKVGCESKSSKPADEVQYDCQEGYGVREKAWSQEKRTWCCDHEQLGCMTDAWNAEPYNCHSGKEDWEKTWSRAKQAWCCEFEGQGCTSPGTSTTTEPFDCLKDLIFWTTRWPKEKQDFCCRHHGRGCFSSSAPDNKHRSSTTTVTFSHHPTLNLTEEQLKLDESEAENPEDIPQGIPLPGPQLQPVFDCSSGYAGWEDIWSPQKKVYCCDGRVRCIHTTGTETATTTESPDAKSTVPPSHSKQGKATTTEPAKPSSSKPVKTTSPRESKAGESKAGESKAVDILDKKPSTTLAASTSKPHRTSLPARSTTTGELYDCHLGVKDWPEKWTGWKKEWCCDRHGVGCPTTQIATTTVVKPYDCLEGITTWEETWTAQKKRWCCKHELRGCTACDVACVVAGFPASCRNRIEWLEKHNLNWAANGCTRARHVVLEECPACTQCQVVDACPKVANLTRYDCDAGRDKLATGWSQTKKDWCCNYFDVGCPPTTTTTTTVTTTTVPFHCNLGDKKKWPSDKRSWCCEHRGIGCTGCDASCVVDGLAATCRDRVGWLLGHVMRHQKDACTHAHGLVQDQCPACAHCGMADACPADKVKTATTTSLPFNCKAGLRNWRLGWSESKRSWCCRHDQLGCRNETKAPSDEYDCHASLSDWSHEKMDWCCTHKKLGCSLLAKEKEASHEKKEGEDKYDCKRDVLNWAQMWTREKKDWCCWRYSVGCSSNPHHREPVISMRWVARDSLPNELGETLKGYSQSVGGLNKMKVWCEEHSDCIGFAMQPESLKWYPKKVGTGFNARTAKWNADKWRGQAWRWYYIKDRSEGSSPEDPEKEETVAAKFEQIPRTGSGPAHSRRRLLTSQVASVFILGCLAVAVSLAAVRAWRPAPSPSRSSRREDGLVTYLALSPANRELRSDLLEE